VESLIFTEVAQIFLSLYFHARTKTVWNAVIRSCSNLNALFLTLFSSLVCHLVYLLFLIRCIKIPVVILCTTFLFSRTSLPSWLSSTFVITYSRSRVWLSPYLLLPQTGLLCTYSRLWDHWYMLLENWWNCDLRGRAEVYGLERHSKRNFSQCHFIHHNPRLTTLNRNPDSRSEKLMSKWL